MTYAASNIIDASGLTSTPNVPKIPGQSEYKGTAIHHKEFGQTDILSNDQCRRIAVIGGAKSAADVAYAAAKAGKAVSWVIRKSGAGPAAFVDASGSGFYKNANESLYNRFVAPFVASLFSKRTWWVRFLHSTALGNKVLGNVWTNIDKGARGHANYDRPEGKENGFSNLKPDTPMFWENDSSGINQRTDFWDVIAKGVKVFRQDIARVTDKSLVLEDDTDVPADTIIYATGWRTTHPYINSRAAARLGLPVEKQFLDQIEASKMKALEEAADKEVLDRYPMLRNAPPHHHREPKTSPFRLYKCMLPVHDHSIVFVGKTAVANQFRQAEVQAMWATAVLDGNVPLPSEEEMEKEIAMTNAWCKRRYLTKGGLGNWLYWDSIPFTDMLLKQIGLSSHRKMPIVDFFAPCVAADLRGLVNEYKKKNKF